MKKFIKEEPKLFISSCGTKRWYLKNELLHREDGPAIEYPDKYQSWYFNEKRIFYFENNEIYFSYRKYSKLEANFIFNNIYLLNKKILIKII